MSNSKNLRLLALAALLILFALPAMSSLTQLSSNHSLFPGVHPVSAAVPNVLGLDCAYGSNLEGSAFPTSITTSAPYSGPDFDGTLDSSCQATYLGDTDGVIHPLVEDNPTAIVAAGAGGGLTIDVVASLNSTTTINGFDISVKYDPHFVNAVVVDQSGLIWGGTGLPVGAFVLTLAKTIDNVNGIARVAQVLVGAPQQGGSSELFRVRFDLVGASTGTPIQIVSDTLTNPGNVQHNTNPATSMDTTSIYNALSGITANLVASWTFSPSPEAPLSPLTFTATATCAGCTAPLGFSWDFSSNDAPTYVAKSQATTNPATVTPPPPVVNRVTLTITDAAAHSFAITRVLPLVAKGPVSATVARKALTGTFAAQWLGGVTTANAAYTGSWTFCPGSALNKQVCSNPTASFSQTPATVTQTSTQPALSYNYAGVYNNTFKVADTAEQQVGTLPTGNVALINFLITVTGTPRAYNVNVSGNTTSVNPGQAINFTAFSSYTLNYTTSRSNTFKYAWDFGDSSPTVTTNGNVTSVVHTYTVVGPHTVTVTATETANAAVSHIIETGTLAITVNSGAFTYGIAGPATGTVGTAVTFTGTTSGGTAPFTFTWNFGDGTGNINTGATASATHTYNTKGTFTVHGNATDSTAKVAQAPAQTITISPLTLAVSFTTAPTTGTVGTAVSFTATASGGTTPYSFSWSFGDGSAKVAGGATNPNTQSHTY
ncbi:PKD domain-containing protein, partial [Candidatus Bathyarchaeota archaeon]